MKRNIKLRRGLGWVKGVITRRERHGHAKTTTKGLVDGTDTTLSMRLPLGKYTAVVEAAAEGSWVLPEAATARSRTLQRELLAPLQGGQPGHRQ